MSSQCSTGAGKSSHLPQAVLFPPQNGTGLLLALAPTVDPPDPALQICQTLHRPASPSCPRACLTLPPTHQTPFVALRGHEQLQMLFLAVTSSCMHLQEKNHRKFTDSYSEIHDIAGHKYTT